MIVKTLRDFLYGQNDNHAVTVEIHGPDGQVALADVWAAAPGEGWMGGKLVLRTKPVLTPHTLVEEEAVPCS